ncbi:MAG: hypothetical protein ACYCZK_03160 [Microbacteriaceae bacterium]
MTEITAVFCGVRGQTHDDENSVMAAQHCFGDMGFEGEVAACGGGLQSEITRSAVFADGLGCRRQAELWRSRCRIDPDAGPTVLYTERDSRYREQLVSLHALWKAGSQW